MLVLAEDAAEAVTSVDVEVGAEQPGRGNCLRDGPSPRRHEGLLGSLC
jgi:hypothetical protein